MKGRAATLLWALASAGGCALALPASAAETAACVTLPNIAHAQYSLGGSTVTLSSNPAPVRVAERLDLHLTAGAASITLGAGELRAVPFTLVNAGNGEEAFLIDGRIDGGDTVIEGFAFDRDGNGQFDAATDLAIAARATTPALEAGASIKLLALVRGNGPNGGTLSLTARAATGTGTPGSAFTGQGDGGCDAVTGATTATGTAIVTLTVAPGTDTSQISIIKSQTITAPNGSADPVPGATVTYSIDSRFGGDGVVRSARLADLIPPGTVYIPGSIRLDGATLTDAADGDAGDFDGTGIRVLLGDVPTPATRRVQFQVKIL